MIGTRILAVACFLLAAAAARGESFLEFESRIPLPGVAGRIDHMAVDPARKRLLVAELGNGSLDAVDLTGGIQPKRIAGLHEPQGVAYSQKTDLVAVASAGDGSVRFFRAEDLSPAGTVALGKDADNIRVDPGTGYLMVGYGSGGLAVIDPAKELKIGDIKLSAHPEGFRLDPETGRIFVNVPDAEQIAVVDLATARQVASWAVPGLRRDFPMAIDASSAVIAAVFRDPAKLVLLNAKSGAATAQLDTCADADDVFFDAKRRRIYVSCGAGVVDLFQKDATGYGRLARVETAPGARTSLFVTELDRLFGTARAGLLGSDAAILVFRPLP